MAVILRCLLVLSKESVRNKVHFCANNSLIKWQIVSAGRCPPSLVPAASLPYGPFTRQLSWVKTQTFCPLLVMDGWVLIPGMVIGPILASFQSVGTCSNCHQRYSGQKRPLILSSIFHHKLVVHLFQEVSKLRFCAHCLSLKGLCFVLIELFECPLEVLNV